jgi:hypothetical protein
MKATTTPKVVSPASTMKEPATSTMTISSMVNVWVSGNCTVEVKKARVPTSKTPPASSALCSAAQSPRRLLMITFCPAMVSSWKPLTLPSSSCILVEGWRRDALDHRGEQPA